MAVFVLKGCFFYTSYISIIAIFIPRKTDAYLGPVKRIAFFMLVSCGCIFDLGRPRNREPGSLRYLWPFC
jgi:hypothetical protein